MTRLVATLFAGAMLALPTAARAQSATDTAHRAMTRAAREERREARAQRGQTETHPAIRGAIRSLERARVELAQASHDFGGHRVDAIKSIDESLKQLRLALEFDKK